MRQQMHEAVSERVSRVINGSLNAAPVTPSILAVRTQSPACGAGRQNPCRQPIAGLLADRAEWWHGRAVAGPDRDGYSTGFPELDAMLPDRGWPRSGLMEVVTRRWGMGELQLLMPLMRSLIAQGKWVLWVAPPCQLYATALAQSGIDNRQVLSIKADTSCRDALRSIEQALQTQHCGLVLAWQNWLPGGVLRRLQLLGEAGETLGVLFKHSDSKYSPAPLRIRLKNSPEESVDGFSRAQVTLLKARGNFRPFTTRLNLYQRRPRD